MSLSRLKNGFLSISLAFFASTVLAEDFKLSGKAKLEYSIFYIDVYDLELRVNSQGHKKLKLTFLTDMKKEWLNEGWDKTLTMVSDSDLKWIKHVTPKAKKGESLEITSIADQVTLFFNTKELAKRQSPELAKFILSPWIGDKPIKKSIKEKLLKNYDQIVSDNKSQLGLEK